MSVPGETRKHSIGSDAAKYCSGLGLGLSAASVSIEPFEVSRLRLRRTRQQPVWISNGVLVLGYRNRRPGNGDSRVDLIAADAAGSIGTTPELRAFRVASVA